MLSEEQAETVLKLLRLIERTGAMPTAIRAVVAKLIPKLKAARLNYRSIGLMASLHRQWCRCRQQYARDWESKHKDPLMGHQSRRSIMEVVFIQALRSEAGQAAQQRLHSGFFLWDLSNFYEHINRQKLWQRAEELDFNLGIAAVSLNQYGSKRYLGLGALTMECQYARRGIAAGCGLATTWVQVYALPPLRVWRVEHPQVPLTMLINDMGGGTTAREEHQVAGRLGAAAASLWSLVEADLDAHVAEHKSVILASSNSLLIKLKRAFGKHAGAPLQSAPNLGIDFAVGRRRAARASTRVLKRRQLKFKRRCRRLLSLKRAGMNMREVFVTGLQAFTHFGAEVVGLDTAQMQTAHSQYLLMAG